MVRNYVARQIVAVVFAVANTYALEAWADSRLLLCKIDGTQVNVPGAQMHPIDGNYVGLTDLGDAIFLNVGGTEKQTLTIIERRDGWLLTAELVDRTSGGKTTLNVLNLPPYEGLTMLMTLSGPNTSGITMKG